MFLDGAFIDSPLNLLQNKHRFSALIGNLPAQMCLRLIAHQIMQRCVVSVLIQTALEFANR